MRTMTYDEWVKAFPEVLNEEEDCPDFEGSGWVECFHCGGEMDCETCKGTGKVKTARKAYEAQRKKDLELLEAAKPLLGWSGVALSSETQ